MRSISRFFYVYIYVYACMYASIYCVKRAWKTGDRGGRSTKRSDTSVNFPVITGRDFTANETGPRVPPLHRNILSNLRGEVRYDFIMDVALSW